MANDKYYAYSTFNTKVNEWGRVEKSIKPGDEVTQSDLGVSDEEWAELIKLGVVSRVPHPTEALRGESPNEAFRREDLALQRGELSDKEAERVKERQAIQAEEADNYQAEATALASAGDDEGSKQVIEEGAEREGTLVESESERDYDAMDVPSLKTLAAKREIEGSSNMNKAALVEAHKNYDAAQPAS